MRKIIVESAYDDEVVGRAPYFVARYEHDTDEEYHRDIKNVFHRGWGKTKDEAKYNLFLQEIRTDKPKKKKYLEKNKYSDFSDLVQSLWSMIFLIIFLYASYQTYNDFGTIKSLEWLIIGIFILKTHHNAGKK